MYIMKLSIIIPVYNVEKYVERCILSCYNQNVSHQLYEIIIVNDGSTDNSYNVVRSLCGSFENVHIYSQSNKGLSAARNAGLSKSSGEFIWFVDSDDWIEPGIIPILFKYMDGNDILALNYKIIYENSSKAFASFYDRFITSGKDLLRGTFNTPAPFYIYSRELLEKNNFKFYEGIFHEDSEFVPRVLFFAGKAIIVPDVAYNYGVRENSIMTSSNSQKSIDCIFVAQRLSSFFEGRELDDQLRDSINNYICMTLCNGFATSNFKEQRRAINMKIFNDKKISAHLRSSSKLKYKLLGYIILLFPWYSMEAYRCLRFLKK